MKILEVKNNLVKISHTAQDDLVLSGFVIIEDSQYPYVAQIMSLKADSGSNYAIAKLLFTFNEEGIVKNYNGTVPELNASITRLSSDELLDILPVEKPLKIGKLAQQDFILNIDYSALEKNLLVCSDKFENSDILISNLAKQITENNNKSVIFDTDSTINAENTLVFGQDFKLPLNYDTINFIYENDLNDVEPTSKAIIQDIFLEVQEYSKTVLDQFIPIDNFIAVVDAQYKEMGIPELALLKNRLLKYKEDNVFAQNAKEIQIIRSAIRGNMSTLFDISGADDILQKQIISYIYDEINSMDLFVYSFVKINNENADKKLIRKFFMQDKIYTTVVSPHNYKYMYELKDRASNMILFAPQTMQHDFASYNIFMNKLNDDECVVYGKATQNIPLIIEMLPLEELDNIVPPARPAVEDNTEEASAPAEPKDDFSEESDSYSYETMMDDQPPQHEEPLEELKQEESEPLIDLPQVDETQEPEAPEAQPVEEPVESQDYEELEEVEEVQAPEENIIDETDEELVEPEQIEQEFDTELIEEAAQEEEPVLPTLEDSDILTEPDLDSDDFENTSYIEEQPEHSDGTVGIEELHNQGETENLELEELPEELSVVDEIVEDEQPSNVPEQVQDSLTEDDLDYIQDVNVPSEQQSIDAQGSEPQQEQPPVVPIYPVDEPSESQNTTTFQPGDRVSHPKYGEGVVEKMIKYGNKVLCSISFENGRRLLDPTISEITKL